MLEDPFDLLRQYSDIAAQRMQEAREKGEPASEIENWDLESRTWNLLALLYTSRSTEAIDEREEPPLMTPVTSKAVLEDWYFRVNKNARESLLVREWLQGCLSVRDKTEPELRGKWQATRARIKGAQAVWNFGGSSSNGDQIQLVTELDVDAPLRQGKSVDKEDAEIDRRVFAYVFRMLQTGEYEAAQDLCERSGNYVLNAALNGLVEYRDPRIDGYYEGMARGTKRKGLWKKMCKQAARSLPDKYERAIYGIMCGDLDSVVAVSDSWESEMLAHVQHSIMEELDENGNVRVHNEGEGNSRAVGEIINVLANTWTSAKHPLRIIQGGIIKEMIGMIVSDTAQKLDNIRDGVEETNILVEERYLLRVITHMMLFLSKMTDVGPQEDAVAVLAGYVEMLTIWGKLRLVPVYVAQLPEREAIEAYSFMLAEVRDAAQRREQFELAEKHGVDIMNTLRRTMQRVFDEHDDTETADERLTDAIMWFVDAGMWRDVIRSANAIYVRFLLAGKVNSAYRLRANLSESGVQQYTSEYEYEADASEIADDISEFKEYERLLDGISSVHAWEAVRDQHSTQRTWKIRAREAVEHVKGTITALLSGWLENFDTGTIFIL